MLLLLCSTIYRHIFDTNQQMHAHTKMEPKRRFKKRKIERSRKSGWGSGELSGFCSAAVRGAEAMLLEPPEPRQNRSRVGQESLGSAHRDTAIGNLTRTHWKTAQWAGPTVTAKPRMTDVGGFDTNPASPRAHLTVKYVGNKLIKLSYK